MLHYELPVVNVLDSTSMRNIIQHPVRFLDLKHSDVASMDLGRYLDRFGLAQVNHTGPTGTSATIRFRGSSGDHTAILWSGFNMNSVSLGSADLSLVPLFFFDQVRLNPQSGLTESTAAGLSATIHLDESGASNKTIRWLASYNSMANATWGADVPYAIKLNKQRSRGSVIHFRTRLLRLSLRNDFKYTDRYQLGNPVLSQQHNDGRQNALKQEVFWNHKSHEMTALLWYQMRSMELPGIMGKSFPGTAEQDDATTKFILTHRYRFKRLETSLGAAYVKDQLFYRDHLSTDGLWLLDSRMQSNVWMNRGELSYSNKQWKITARGSSQLFVVRSANYIQSVVKEHRNQLATTLTKKVRKGYFEFDYKADQRLSAIAHSWSVNYAWHFSDSISSYGWSLQASRVFRFPDLNELYWKLGGNADLKPEWGYRYAWSGVFEKRIHRIKISSRPSVFYSEIHDWIQWIPQSSAIWSPVNLRLVRSKGAEVPLFCEATWGKKHALFSAQYAYTLAESVQLSAWDKQQASQMIYTPNHLIASELQLGFDRIRMGLAARYTSERYTDETNSKLRQLDPYTLYNLWLSGKMERTSHILELVLSVQNIFNTSYESVRSYAMPGRVIQLTATYSINK